MNGAMRHMLDLSVERGVIHSLLRRLPPDRARQANHKLRRLARPARLGTLRKGPFSHNFGYDRGTPVDRYYIEHFLWTRRELVRGRVLEVKDSTYTDRFDSGVTHRDILDLDSSNPQATFIADLAAADTIPEGTFDCFILTQTLQLIYDVRSAIAHAHRILKPGGALLVTVPTVSPVVDDEDLTDYWRFTVASCGELFGETFGQDHVWVRGYGNLLTSIAFLAGMAREELTKLELTAQDQRFAMLVAVVATKR
jgi:SAM-dependent methyltransferase